MSLEPFSFAVHYRNAGWLGTLPLPVGLKESPPTGFTGNGAPYPTDSQVAKWAGAPQQNLCLRLAEVPGYTPKGHPPVGYEVIVIDVDQYGAKNGADNYAKLVAQLGDLPATVMSSARWDTSPDSGHRYYLVPAGYRFLGKAAKCIDVIQKGHRYVLVWPSTNPDAENAIYRFRSPEGAYYDETPGAEANPALAIPPLDDVAVLPDSWFQMLTCGGMAAVDIPISDMTGNELAKWAVDNFREVDGDMCRLMEQQLNRQLARLETDPDSHPNLIAAHWELSRLGMEGHSGWLNAIKVYNKKWIDSAGEKRDELPDAGEVNRSVYGTLSKLEPEWKTLGGVLVSDTCESGDYEEPDSNWLNIEDVDPDVAEAIANMDYGGLGPVVGKLERLPAKSPDDYEQNDRGNGKHFIDLYGENVKYVEARKAWVLWAGGRWHRDQEDKLVNLAFDVVKRRQIEFAKLLPRGDKAEIAKAKSWTNWAVRSGNLSQVKNAIGMAKADYHGDEPVAMSGNQFDSNPELLGCANGILELRAQPVLREPRKQDYVTYNTNVAYYPWDTETANEHGLTDAYALWQNYLETFLPDPELRRFVQIALGHCLIGENPEKLIIFIYGPHDTGKSTLLGGIRGALGDYFGTIDMNLFKSRDLNPGLIRAVPLRVTGMSEVDGGKMEGAVIKRLTGNDTVTAEAKYSNEIFEGRPQFTTLIACNTEPEITNADEALRERVLILPFENTIPRAERQYARQADIERQSGEAVLAWLVEGWKLYCQFGLKRSTWPAAVRKLSGEVVNHFNATQTFIVEHFEKAMECAEGQRAWERAKRVAAKSGKPAPTAADWDKQWTPSAANVYETYVRWCQENNVPAVSKIQFGKDLGLGRADQRKLEAGTVKVYVGMRWRDKDDEPKEAK